MSEHSNELKKLADIAMDLQLSADLRIKAIESLGRIGTHEALLTLLNLASREDLVGKERELALKRATEIIKSGH